MSDLISRKALIEAINSQVLGMSEFAKDIRQDLIDIVNGQPTAYDISESDIRLLENCLDNMTKAYRQRSQNWVVVQDLLMNRTSHAGMTSSIAKCRELGIDPYGYTLKGAAKDE